MRHFKAFFLSLCVSLGFIANASACITGESASFYSRLMPSLSISSATPNLFYVRFQGDLRQLNQLLAGGVAGSTTGGAEPVYASLIAARSLQGGGASYVLGLNKASRTLESVHDARSGKPMQVYYAKGGCHPFVE